MKGGRPQIDQITFHLASAHLFDQDSKGLA